MTFRTREMIRLWRGFRDELVEYWHAVRTLDFSTAHRCAEVLVAEAEDHRGCLADSCSGEVLNDQFLLETALGVLGQYAAYWDALMQEQYSWSWSSLQDTQDSLRLIKRFGRRPDILIWSAIERQCGGLERLYPYRIFVSSELTHSALECSICGRRMDDPACPHIPGDLYRGELALGIVRDIIDVFALALVRNPMDKRCVIVLPDDSERFKAVAYLRGELKSDKLDPFRLHGVEYEGMSRELLKLTSRRPRTFTLSILQ